MIIEKRNPLISEYLNLRSEVGWRDVEKDSTEKALRNSLCSVVAIENDKVIGVGRIIGDGGLYFYVQDLIVHPDYQNEGLGKRLMEKLMDYIDENAKQGAFVGLRVREKISLHSSRSDLRLDLVGPIEQDRRNNRLFRGFCD